jgi:alpha-galactosidase
MKISAALSIATTVILLSAPQSVRAWNDGIQSRELTVEANSATGSYMIRTTRRPEDSLAAGVAAKVDGKWFRASDYPRHEVSQGALASPPGHEIILTILNTGLSGAPDLIARLSLSDDAPALQISVEVRNTAGKEIAVQAIRVLDAQVGSFLNLNGPDSAIRVLSDSFSEDRPTMLIHDLSDAENGMHRAVGSQLIYNRQSGQSLFLGALSSESWLTVLRLHLDSSKSKITSLEVDSTGTTELARDNSLRDSPPEDQMELSLPVQPGASLSSESVMVSLGDDYHAQLESYGAAVSALHHPRVASPTPIGWWSWTAYYFGLTEGAALTNAQWLSAHLANFGYKFFHIDEGYQYARGEYTTPDAVMFPHGMLSLESKVRALGLTPGIWTAPFEVSERSSVFANHKGWLVHNAAGQPIHAGFVDENKDQLYILDATNPGAQEYLRQTYRTLTRDWSIRYIKLDFMDDSAIEGVRYRPNTTALEAQRIGLQIIRDTVGNDVLLDKDGSPMLNPVGIVDAGRISADTGHSFDDTKASATGIAARYWMNRNFFLSDPDAFNISSQKPAGEDHPLTLDEAKVSIALAAVSGGMFEIGDDLPTLSLDPDRLALVENRELINMARWGHASVPFDLMTFPPEQGRPSEFVLQEGPARAIVTLFNWSDASFTRNFQPAPGESPGETFHRVFGLPKGDYRVSDILASDAPVDFAALQGNLVQPRHSVRMLKFVKIGTAPAAAHVEISAPEAGQVGQDVDFSAKANDEGVPIVAYTWDFGDGTSAQGPRVSHAFTHAGKFGVVLTAEAIDGSSQESAHEINLSGSFDYKFTPSRNRRFLAGRPESNSAGSPQ